LNAPLVPGILVFVRVHSIPFFLSAALLLESNDPLIAAGTNQLRPWDSYRTIMWVGDTAYKKPEKLPLFFQRLRELGINTAMVFGDGNPQPLLDNHFPYYLENMVSRGLSLKFHSQVTDWISSSPPGRKTAGRKMPSSVTIAWTIPNGVVRRASRCSNSSASTVLINRSPMTFATSFPSPSPPIPLTSTSIPWRCGNSANG